MSADDPAKTAVDPSMEDILASIRRILTEEDVATNGDAPPPDGEDRHGDDPSEDVLTLDEAMLVEAPSPLPAPAEPLSPQPAHTSHIGLAEPPLRNLPAHSAPVTRPSPIAIEPQLAPSELIAPEAQDCAAASLGDLVRSLQAERHAAVYRGGPTIEDIVRAEIRPVLKSWLDTHLPGLVERLVRAEIERLAARAEV